jgi:hypothetical protein
VCVVYAQGLQKAVVEEAGPVSVFRDKVDKDGRWRTLAHAHAFTHTHIYTHTSTHIGTIHAYTHTLNIHTHV